MKKMISLLLAMMMVVSLAACGDTASKESTPTSEKTSESKAEVKEESKETTAATEESKEEKIEPATVTLFPANGNLTSGTVGGWAGEVFAEEGIILDVWAYSADKFNAILASGDLPDVMFFPTNKCDINAIAESGYLMDLSGYMDKLPAISNSEAMGVAVNFLQDYVLTGTDELVALPVKVGPLQTKLNTGGCGLNMNWELYEQIGAPEITCLEDTIDVFKKMQAAWPESETGIKTYAMHLYSSADNGFFAGANNVLKLNGYMTSELQYFIAANTETNELEYMLEDDGIYKYALGQFTRNYTQTTKRGLLTTNKG